MLDYFLKVVQAYGLVLFGLLHGALGAEGFLVRLAHFAAAGALAGGMR